jgi:hypothetical protein
MADDADVTGASADSDSDSDSDSNAESEDDAWKSDKCCDEQMTILLVLHA